MNITEAIKAKAKHFDSDRPCPKCGGTKRYVSGNKPCVACCAAHAKRYREKNREKLTEYHRQWRQENEMHLRRYSNKRRRERANV